jgi:hypothetical protein
MRSSSQVPACDEKETRNCRLIRYGRSNSAGRPSTITAANAISVFASKSIRLAWLAKGRTSERQRSARSTKARKPASIPISR